MKPQPNSCLREPCAAIREDGGKTSVVMRADRVMEHRKAQRSGGRRQNELSRIGERNSDPRCRRAHVRSYMSCRDLEEEPEHFGPGFRTGRTRLLEFGRFAVTDHRKGGECRPETCDFPGFAHHGCIDRKGRFGLGRNPIFIRRAVIDASADLVERGATPLPEGAYLMRVH